MKIRYKLILMLMIACSLKLSAQVNIGNLKAPAQAALLQVKDIEPTDPAVNNETTATGGLLLPRVQLEGESTLAPFIDPAGADYAAQKLLHVGLMVYNLTDDGEFLTPGVYVWNGEHWKGASLKSSDFWMTVSTNLLNFPSGIGSGTINPTPITVQWAPAGNTCALIFTAIQRGGVIVKNPQAATNNTGTDVLSIELEPFTQAEVDANPFLIKATQLKVIANDGGGTTMEELIELRQTHYALVVSNFEEEVRMGTQKTLKVASNTNWSVEVSDPNGILQSYAPLVGGNNVNGENFTFAVVNDETKQGKKATITFKHSTGAFAPQVFSITAIKEFPNSYFVQPNTTIEIPVRKAYDVWESYLGESLSGSQSVGLLWQDEQGLIQSVQLANGDKGILSKIKVTANDKIGNAVVNLMLGGQVVWSWHLWVTDYSPNMTLPAYGEGESGETVVTNGSIWTYYNGRRTITFMDRYLGAYTHDYTDAKVKGLLYQWGRHIPFTPQDPFTTGTGRATARKIYDINNVQYTTEGDGFTLLDVPTDVNNNVKNALNNPMVFYKGATTNDNDWYSAILGVEDNNLWSTAEGKKAVFDPCPEGWRVPTSGNGTQSPWYGLTNKSMDETLPINNVINAGDFRAQGAGIFAISGSRSQSTGNNSFGTVAIPWSATAADAASLTIYRNHTAFNPFYIQPRALGLAVRCVKDE